MPQAMVNGVKLNYVQIDCEREGACEDLIFVHGLSTNMAFWCFHYATELSRYYRITVYDLRGHGRSGMTGNGYTPNNMSIDLRDLMDHLKIKKAHFIAHSFGGVITLNLACLYPERVSSLVLADTHISAIRRMEKDKVWAYGKKIQKILDENGFDIDTSLPYFGYRLLNKVAHLQLANAKISMDLHELISPILGKYSKRTASQWLQLMDTTTAEHELMGDDYLSLESLKRLNFPLLAIYGEHSQAMLTGDHLLDVWGHAIFRRIRDAGHFFPTSRPGEVITLCKQFWNGELTNAVIVRNGEGKKNYFRSDRLYSRDGAWYFYTREEEEKGPFFDYKDAKKNLETFISLNKVS
ncbi:MAG: alpha/beta hydrolase [Gammaproteobacteria bacterium]|nr:alpha/beta hydrolase [Gammaproteobacteria bacterium]